METRTCAMCKAPKSPEEFGNNGKYKKSYCKPCESKRVTAREHKLSVERKAIKAAKTTKKCLGCTQELSVDSFRDRNKQSVKGYTMHYKSERCFDCENKASKAYSASSEGAAVHKAWRTSNETRNAYFQKQYNITLEKFNQLFEGQEGLCACCSALMEQPGLGQKKNFRTACVDHDHKCCAGTKSCGKCIRGILCGRCNIAAGMLKDDSHLCRNLANYLATDRRAAVA